MVMSALIDQLKAARACATPLLAITTPDQPAVVQMISKELNGSAPIISWDRTNGFLAINTKGHATLEAWCKKQGISPNDLPFATCEAHNAMRLASTLPGAIPGASGGTILIAYSLNRFFREESPAQTIQAILNLRDLYKGDGRTLIGLSPDFALPVEIQHDVILLDDPLPTDAGYTEILSELYEGAGLSRPEKDESALATRAVRGLSAFEADQVLAMSMPRDKKGNWGRVILDEAWKLKVAAVNKVKGLSMTLDGPDVSDLRGLDNAVSILDDLWAGPEPPELVVRVDEMDKSLGGIGQNGPGDNTGIAQDMHQQFLTNLEDNGWIGALLFGVRGGGKTVLTQAIGKAHNVPTIAMDTGAMKGGIVGTSEAHIRDAFRTMRSIGGKRVVVLATCNRMDNFSAELLRRFKLGVIYFDLLTEEERDSLWPIYLKKYHHATSSPRPDDTGWTGAEIRNCCELAYKMNRTPKAVGETMIVPFTKSSPKQLEILRAQADGNYVSAAYAGLYRTPVAAAAIPQARRFKGDN
jgi:hypothetical protein